MVFVNLLNRIIGIVLGKCVIGCNGCNEKEEIFLSWKFCNISFSLLVLREIILLESFLNVWRKGLCCSCEEAGSRNIVFFKLLCI